LLDSGLTAAQLTNAYGLNAISFKAPSGTMVTGLGSGETIALVEAYHDPTVRHDVHTFDQSNDLTDPKLTVINQAGARSSDAWAAEESLDVEWAHSIAPGAAILVVEAASQSLTDLLAAVDTARHAPGVVALSMSWGFSEAAAEASYDSTFTTPAGHEGITFVASSGDSGPASGADYPAASPEVLSVGGTTLNLDAQGNYLSESIWIDSGGGYSLYEAEPGYQASIQSTGQRSTPDVAFDADPSTGVEVYQTPLHSSHGSWQTVGGTSLGAPAWAAIIAIADQGRALEGKPSLDGPTQTLPTLYAIPSSDFHAVTRPAPYSPWGGGVNPFGFLPFVGLGSRRSRALHVSGPTTGRRTLTATGLGSPNAPPLVADLVASSITSPLPALAGAQAPAQTRPRHRRARSGHHH
jgi:subtilase family serine protease